MLWYLHMKYSKLFMKLQIPNLRKHQIFSLIDLNQSFTCRILVNQVSKLRAKFFKSLLCYQHWHQEMLFKPPGDVECQNSWCSNVFQWKVTPISMFLKYFLFSVCRSKKVLLKPTGGVWWHINNIINQCFGHICLNAPP